MKIYGGVDIGNKGAITLMRQDMSIIDKMIMPTFEIQMTSSKSAAKSAKAKKRTYTDNLKVYDWIKKYSEMGYEMTFAVEIIFALRSSYASMNLGIGYGLLWAALEHFGKIEFITPVEWQVDMGKAYSHLIPKLDRSGITHLEEKKAVPIGLVRHFFSNDILLPSKRHKVPHDGLADSIMIADYIRRRKL